MFLRPDPPLNDEDDFESPLAQSKDHNSLVVLQKKMKDYAVFPPTLDLDELRSTLGGYVELNLFKREFKTSLKLKKISISMISMIVGNGVRLNLLKLLLKFLVLCALLSTSH